MPESDPKQQSCRDVAAALGYRQGVDSAPRVIAAGRGELARKILETARDAGIEIVQDGDLVEILAGLPTGEEIPPELYQVIADLFACLYRLNNSLAQSHS
ncbi:MAG: FlhB-like flagellar biosynthesis protein [Geothermobacteraceae bacterium]